MNQPRRRRQAPPPDDHGHSKNIGIRSGHPLYDKTTFPGLNKLYKKKPLPIHAQNGIFKSMQCTRLTNIKVWPQYVKTITRQSPKVIKNKSNKANSFLMKVSQQCFSLLWQHVSLNWSLWHPTLDQIFEFECVILHYVVKATQATITCSFNLIIIIHIHVLINSMTLFHQFT